MIHTDKNNFPYYESLDEAREDGYSPVKVGSVVEFFTLAGRKTTLLKENFIPIPDLKYMVLNGQDCYYVREFNQKWTLDMLFFYRKSLDFSGEDDAINNLRNLVEQQAVWLLLTEDAVNNTSNLLTRLYKANLEGEGKLPYRIYVKIVIESLKYEDFRIYGGDKLVGYKTVCRIFETNILDLYKQAYELNNKQT